MQSTNHETVNDTSQSVYETVNGTSHSVYETVEGSHEYKITGYSLAKGMGVGQSMTSWKFTVGGYDWVLRFYPDGYDQAYQEYVGVFLELVSPGKVRASYEFKIMDQSGKGIHRLRSSTSIKKFNIETFWYVRACFPIPMVAELLTLNPLA
ncbi:hypothetical protein MKW94_029089, partial [Papaver nudicaule]|nr:hypothetical protein [Papaver nudicaule]